MPPSRSVTDGGSPPPTDPAAVSLYVRITEAARRLGMTTSALRAWERRYGIGPSARTGGGHRRYSLQDLERLRRMQQLLREGVPAAEAALLIPAGGDAAVPAPRGAPAAAAELRRQLAEAVLHYDPVHIADLVRSDLAARGVAAAWRDVLVPVLVSVGEHWQRTGAGVAAEHLASGTIESVLRRHATLLAERHSADRRPVLVAATAGERHTLPPVVLTAALVERGVSALFLDSLPAEALHEAVVRARGRCVVVWARAPETADPGALARAGDAGDVPVYAAGPGWAPARLPGGTPHLESLEEALGALVP